jgi:predicted nucleic acid-binding protein
MDSVLLDTDILNEVLKQKNTLVLQHARVYFQQHGQFAISALSRYEVLRGLKEKNATTQLSRFATFCQHSILLPITDTVLDRAADLWVTARQGGYPRSDADLIIAATALEHGRVLVTGNTPHFAWVPRLVIANWREP